MTVQRELDDISKDAETQLPEIFNKCVYYSLGIAELDTISTTQMCKFSSDVTYDFEVSEELVVSIQCKTKQRDNISFRHYYAAFRSIIWNYLSL
jgi:hypothetical protein